MSQTGVSSLSIEWGYLRALPESYVDEAVVGNWNCVLSHQW